MEVGCIKKKKLRFNNFRFSESAYIFTCNTCAHSLDRWNDSSMKLIFSLIETGFGDSRTSPSSFPLIHRNAFQLFRPRSRIVQSGT